MDDLLVSILIVNYNGRRHLPACLAALAMQTMPRHRFEVVVVDNASTDGSADDAAASFPWLRLVRLRANVGYAEGNNAGLPYLHGRYVVLLNNDAIPDPYWLAELAEAIRPGSTAASKLVFEHDPTIINSAGLQLLRDGRGFDLGFRDRDDGRFESPREVFAACGAALLLDRAAIGDRCFDPRYFMYYEDLDAAWGAQARCRGTIYAPRSLVRHVHGGSAGDESPLFRFHVERNRTLTSIRNGDLFLAIAAVLGQTLRLGRAALRLLRRKERLALAAAQARAFLSMLRHLPNAVQERYRRRQEMRCVS